MSIGKSLRLLFMVKYERFYFTLFLIQRLLIAELYLHPVIEKKTKHYNDINPWVWLKMMLFSLTSSNFRSPGTPIPTYTGFLGIQRHGF